MSYGFRRRKDAQLAAAIVRQRPPNQWNQRQPTLDAGTVLVQIPEEGIPARSGTTPGKVKCKLTYLDTGGELQTVKRRPLNATGQIQPLADHEIEVYNLRENVLPAGYATAVKYGRVYFASGGGVGSGDIDCSELCSQCPELFTSTADPEQCVPPHLQRIEVELFGWRNCPARIGDEPIGEYCTGVKWQSMNRKFIYTLHPDFTETLEGMDRTIENNYNVGFVTVTFDDPGLGDTQFEQRVDIAVTSASWFFHITDLYGYIPMPAGANPGMVYNQIGSALQSPTSGDKQGGQYVSCIYHANTSCDPSFDPNWPTQMSWAVTCNNGKDWGEEAGCPDQLAAAFYHEFKGQMHVSGCRKSDAAKILAGGKDHALVRVGVLAKLLNINAQVIGDWLNAQN